MRSTRATRARMRPWQRRLEKIFDALFVWVKSQCELEERNLVSLVRRKKTQARAWQASKQGHLAISLFDLSVRARLGDYKDTKSGGMCGAMRVSVRPTM